MGRSTVFAPEHQVGRRLRLDNACEPWTLSSEKQ
jgi:hypothetical protein